MNTEQREAMQRGEREVRRVGRVTVGRSNVAGEFQVRVWDTAGERWPEADYFTNNREDARDTAALMVKRDQISEMADSDPQAASLLLELACQAVERAFDVAGLDGVRLALAQSFAAHEQALSEDASRAADVLGGLVEPDAPELPERLRDIAAMRVEAMRALYVSVLLRAPIDLSKITPSLLNLAQLEHKTAHLDRQLARLTNAPAAALRTLGDFNRTK